MGVLEGQKLLRELTAHIVQQKFVYRHAWMEGDLVIWDNRSVLHRGRPWDQSFRRLHARATLSESGNDVVEAGLVPGGAEGESAPFPSLEEARAWHEACGANDAEQSPHVFFAPPPILHEVASRGESPTTATTNNSSS